MKVMNRLKQAILGADAEAALCRDKEVDWNKLAEASSPDQRREACVRTAQLWHDRAELAVEWATMLRELQATCKARGMTEDPECICPDNAHDESCPVCIPPMTR